uniref:Uncharacterized protein n=1 Tax=Ditylum brightwellii TaxID=49249 RepID=A0A7S4SGK2_9STRA
MGLVYRSDNMMALPWRNRLKLDAMTMMMATMVRVMLMMHQSRHTSNRTTEEEEANDATKIHHKLWSTHQSQQQLSQIVPPQWKRKLLSLQAAQITSQSNDPLLTSQDVSQNLPSLASALVELPISSIFMQNADMVLKKISDETNADMTKQGIFAFYVNGQPSFNLFQLINIFREEDELLYTLEENMFDLLERNEKALEVVREAMEMGEHMESGTNNNNDDEDDTTASTYRIDVGRGWKNAILYLNDIEKNSQYNSWSRNMMNFIMAAQYGHPHTVRRNIFAMLIVVDTTVGQRYDVLDMSMQLMQMRYPIRLGILFVGEEDVKACRSGVKSEEEVDDGEVVSCDDVLLAKSSSEENTEQKSTQERMASSTSFITTQEAYQLFQIVLKHNRVAGIHYIHEITKTFASMKEGGMNHGRAQHKPTLEEYINLHSTVVSNVLGISNSEAKAEAIQVLSTAPVVTEKTESYGKSVQFAVTKSIGAGMSFFNGVPMPTSSGQDFMEGTSRVFKEEMQFISELVMKQEITDSRPRSIYARVLKGDNVFERLHPLLLKSKDKKNSHIYISHDIVGDSSLWYPATTTTPSDGDDNDIATFLVEAYFDLQTTKGLRLALSFMSTMSEFPSTLNNNGKDGDDVSVAYRILPSSNNVDDVQLNPIISYLQSEEYRKEGDTTGAILKSIISSLLDAHVGSKSSEGVDLHGIISNMAIINDTTREELLKIATDNKGNPLEYLQKKKLPADNFMIANGRVFIPELDSVETDDIELLLSLEMKRARALTNMLRPHISKGGLFEAVGGASAFLGEQTSSSSKQTRTNTDSQIAFLKEKDGEDQNPLLFVWNEDESTDAESGRKLQVS